MNEQPTTLKSELDSLETALNVASEIVFDFETSGLLPHEDDAVGLGVYIPNTAAAFYINVGHHARDNDFPKFASEGLAKAIQPFFADPANRAIAHNATFDLRCLFKLGVTVRCQIACTYTNAHRVDENIKRFGKEPTVHHWCDASHGLKELITIYFNEQAPSLHGTIGKTNAMFADVGDVARYCVLDVWNTSRLHELTNRKIQDDYRLVRLTETIDNPNHMVVAKMMWRGILIDRDEAIRQQAIYETAIQQCRVHIWKQLKTNQPLDTPKEALKVFRSLGFAEELNYNPFFEATEDYEEEPDASVTREIVTEVFDECLDEHKRLTLALFLSMWTMKQRISSFFNPMLKHTRHSKGVLYPSRFSSTLVTTRFSCKPNMQNLPGRADKTGDEPTQTILPSGCSEQFATRNIFVARPGYQLVSIDLSAAEPRYLALLFQRGLRYRDQLYRGEKSRRQDLRRREQPRLLRAMYESQDDLDSETYTANEIRWPNYHDDPLWLSFRRGEDPYNTLLKSIDSVGYAKAVQKGNAEKWLKTNRWRGKRAFLALAYGSGAESLAPGLKWSVDRTKAALNKLETDFATLQPLKELTRMEIMHLGEVRSLWNRPRRLNGYYQLTHPYQVTLEYYLMKPTFHLYHIDIVPLGTTKFGIQAFIKECRLILSNREHIVLSGKSNGTVGHIDNRDPFVRNIKDTQYQNPPFANLHYSHMRWVEDEHQLRRFFPRNNKIERAERQAFNAMGQSTGADHLRWLMNLMDTEIENRSEFQDCHLILTVHDSLVFEVPETTVSKFVKVADPVISQRPYWADIDIKVDIEVGRKFGDLRKV